MRNVIEDTKTKLRLTLRRWLNVERDLQAHQIARNSDLVKIAEEVEKVAKTIELLRKNHYAHYTPLTQYVQNLGHTLAALDSRIKYYSDHNDGLAFTARKYDRLIAVQKAEAAAKQSTKA